MGLVQGAVLLAACRIGQTLCFQSFPGVFTIAACMRYRDPLMTLGQSCRVNKLHSKRERIALQSDTDDIDTAAGKRQSRSYSPADAKRGALLCDCRMHLAV